MKRVNSLSADLKIAVNIDGQWNVTPVLFVLTGNPDWEEVKVGEYDL